MIKPDLQHPASRRMRNNESGVALVFALAILALLLVMLIGFLSSSLLERKAMANQTAHVGSKIAARSALRKVATTLKYYGTDINTMILYGDDGLGKTIMPFASHGPTGPGTVNPASPDPILDGKLPYELLKDAFFVDSNGNGYFSEDAWFPADDDDTPIYRKAEWLPLQAGNNGRLTGRIAYLIFPNLGINPLHFQPEDKTYSANDTLKQELYYNDNDKSLTLKNTALTSLPFVGNSIVANSPAMVLTGTAPAITNWISPDFMTAYYNDYGPGKSVYSIKAKTSSDYGYTDLRNTSNNAIVRDFFNLYFMPHTATYAADGTTPNIRGGEKTADRFNLYDFSFWENQSNIVTPGNFTELKHLQKFSSPQKEQILANLIDYCDTDSVPTSDVAAATWKTTTTHPTYAGNEKTPYLAQLAVLYQTVGGARYKVTPVVVGNATEYHLQIWFQLKLQVSPLVKLVNLYEEDSSGKWEAYLRDFQFQITGKAYVKGDTLPTPADEEGKGTSFTFQPVAEDFNIPEKALSASIQKHAYFPLELSTPKTYKSLEIQCPDIIIASSTPTNEELTVHFDVQLEEQRLGSIVLSKDGQPVDYAYCTTGVCTTATAGFPKALYEKDLEGETLTPHTEEIIAENSSTIVFDDDKLGNGYTTSVETIDPRCNLVMDVGGGEEKYWKTTTGFYGPATNKESKNTVSEDPKNDDFAEDKDLEPSDDVKDVNSGQFFRNGPMRSAAELGLIHRGEPFQTLNLTLRNPDAATTNSVDYKDGDGVLWDQVKPTRLGYDQIANIYTEPVASNTPTGATETGLLYDDTKKMVRFNVNTPSIHEQAFRLLTGNLRYRDQDGNYQKLSEKARNSLAKWIAYRCYKADGGEPTADGSTRYPNYRSWGELANVFYDWAKNKTESEAPVFTDYALEELIGATMALTRLGEQYEYYTVLIVAQSIKDVGGDGASKMIYRFYADGSPLESNIDKYIDKYGGRSCTLGTYEEGFDEITDTTYLVARLRRKLTECKDDTSCKAGYHLNCTHEIEVLESYLVPR